jgi:hypothetical protein
VIEEARKQRFPNLKMHIFPGYDDVGAQTQ